MLNALPRADFAIHDLHNDRCWSGDQITAAALKRAHVLARFITPDKRNFVIAHGNSPDFFADLFAVWQIGGCAVCVNPGLTAPELTNIIEFCDPAAILLDSEIAGSFKAPTLCTWQEPDSDTFLPAIAQHIDDSALILFTSGTTGDPKGVVHSHRSLLARVSLNVAHMGAETLGNTLCVLPTHFGHGLIGNCLTPLSTGATLYLMPNPGIAGAANLGDVIDKYQISFLSSVPSFWKLALRMSSSPTGNSLKRINIGSAPLSVDIWQGVIDWANGAEVANMYGITETANWIGGASNRDGNIHDGLLSQLWGGSAAIKTDDGQIISSGSGEILLRVPSLMIGYYQRPDLTDKVMSDGWYHTGDNGTLAPDGTLSLTGRNANIIINSGINIFPEELDLLFERHPDVTEACAFPLEDEISGESVALAVALRDGSSITPTDLQAWARERLRAEAIPRDIFMLAEIPKTDRGKLNRALVARTCLKLEHKT